MVGHPNVHDLHRVEPEPDEVGGDCPGAVGRTGLQPVVDGDAQRRPSRVAEWASAAASASESAPGARDQDAFDGRQVCQRLDGPSYDRHRCGDHVDNARVDGGKVDMITGKGDDPWTRRTQATGSVISSSMGNLWSTPTRG